KFHCRRQSGMNFGYVTVNGVDSNVAGLHAIVDWIVCIIYGITTERKKEAASSFESCFHFLNYSLLS
ncbi:hypothetical protein, partial [Blautia wexlerae]|uniref:hypothetical protein n=2 Tax=Blautia wexlerae TaxID=418240 RepID=UPI001A9B764C